MITRSDWDRALIPTVLLLVVFTPLVALRIRQSWRHRSSIPAVAAGVLATVLYSWWLVGVEPIWRLLPSMIRGVLDAALWSIVTVAPLQVFMVGVGCDLSAARLRRRVRALMVVAAVVFVVVLGLNAAAPRCPGPDLYACSSTPLPRNDIQVAGALMCACYVLTVLAQCVWLGLRRADRTPVGWGMALLACGCVAYAIPAFHAGIYRQLNPGAAGATFTSAPWLENVPAAVGTVLLFAGFVYPPVAIRCSARQRLRQLAPLWRAVCARYPDLAAQTGTRTSWPVRVSEQIAYIQDALTLTAQQRRTPLQGEIAPARLPDRAAAVARWLAADGVPQLNCTWLAAPEGVNDEQWVRALASSIAVMPCCRRQECLRRCASD